MKKSIVVLFFAAMAVFAVSCQKEGKFDPNRKILSIDEVITDANGDVTTKPYEVWNWEFEGGFTPFGNKLESIYYAWLDTYEAFTYKNHRIVSSHIDNFFVKYVYNGNKLYRMEIYQGMSMVNMNDFESAFEFEHKGNKITKITHFMRADVVDEKCLAVNPLGHFLPEYICDIIKNDDQMEVKRVKAEGIKEEQKVYRVYNLTWKGSNVVKVDCESLINGENQFNSTTEMTFDNKHNPYQGLFSYYGMLLQPEEYRYDANNMLSCTTTETYANGDVYTYNTEYTYQYDKYGYPESYTYTVTSNVLEPERKSFKISYIED